MAVAVHRVRIGLRRVESIVVIAGEVVAGHDSSAWEQAGLANHSRIIAVVVGVRAGAGEAGVDVVDAGIDDGDLHPRAGQRAGQAGAGPQRRRTDQRHARLKVALMSDQLMDGLDPRQPGNRAQRAGVDTGRDAIVDSLRAIEYLCPEAGKWREQALLRLGHLCQLRLGRLERRRAGLRLRVGLDGRGAVELDHDPELAALSEQRIVNRRLWADILSGNLSHRQLRPAGGGDVGAGALTCLAGEGQDQAGHKQ
jgi:hypothetical protein